jgi:hypothetical protein
MYLCVNRPSTFEIQVLRTLSVVLLIFPSQCDMFVKETSKFQAFKVGIIPWQKSMSIYKKKWTFSPRMPIGFAFCWQIWTHYAESFRMTYVSYVFRKTCFSWFRAFAVLLLFWILDKTIGFWLFIFLRNKLWISCWKYRKRDVTSLRAEFFCKIQLWYSQLRKFVFFLQRQECKIVAEKILQFFTDPLGMFGSITSPQPQWMQRSVCAVFVQVCLCTGSLHI